ncbi:MAG: hypothetical protein CMG13_01970 [Candidatus Marinimicrobia bacterium]|nr:hypothetical protein [Candidatus Neomarinimicrobiota bacterium]
MKNEVMGILSAIFSIGGLYLFLSWDSSPSSSSSDYDYDYKPYKSNRPKNLDCYNIMYDPLTQCGEWCFIECDSYEGTTDCWCVN